MQQKVLAEPPEAFCCPIHGGLMVDPVSVIANDSMITYDRCSIEAWFKNHDTDPLSNSPLADKRLYPNRVLKDAIKEYLGVMSQVAVLVDEVEPNKNDAIPVPAPAPAAPAPAQAPVPVSPYSAAEFAELANDLSRMRQALIHVHDAERFTAEQLFTLGKADPEIALLIVTDPVLTLRLNKDERYILIAEHLDRQAIQPASRSVFPLLDLSEKLQLICHNSFTRSFDEESRVLLLQSLLFDQSLWPQLEIAHWESIFSCYSGVAKELVQNKNYNGSVIHKLPNDILEILYRTIRKHPADECKLIERMLLDEDICDRISPDTFYHPDNNYTLTYLILLIESDYVINRLIQKIEIFRELAHNHQFQDKPRRIAALTKIKSMIHPLNNAADLLLYYTFCQDLAVENQADAVCLNTLPREQKIKLALVNSSCFSLFYSQGHLFDGINYTELDQLKLKYKDFFAHVDITEVEMRLYHDLAIEIRRSLGQQHRFIRKGMEISSLAANADCHTAIVLVHEGLWRQSDNPFQCLLSLCEKHENVKVWVIKSIDLRLIEGLSEYAKNSPYKAVYDNILVAQNDIGKDEQRYNKAKVDKCALQ